MSNVTQFPGGALSPTRRGMELAIDMCTELEEPLATAAGLQLNDVCQLEAEYREGQPFRNIVLERLEIARQLGTEVEFGFCAILSHLVSLNAGGSGVRGDDMDRILEIAAL